MDEDKPKKPRKRNDIKGTGQDWRKGKLALTPEQVRETFEEYTGYCNDNKRRPTWEGFAVRLGISSETLMLWLNAKSEEDKAYNPEMVEQLKKVRDWLTDDLQQRTDSMAVFSLKQPRYGGYTDRQAVENSGVVKLDVVIKGVEGAFE